MSVTLDKFEQTDSFGQIQKLEREVKTPVPNKEEYSSGNGEEENRMVCYTFNEYVVKVAKVSDIGWSVTRYEDGESDKIEPGTYYEEDEAHTRARELIEEVTE
jgi:hypothetical protein